MSGKSGSAPAELRFLATEKEGEVSALLLRPRGARSLLARIMHNYFRLTIVMYSSTRKSSVENRQSKIVTRKSSV